MNLTPTLLNQIRETLRDCGLVDNDRQLRALFVDPRIRPWRDRLPTHSATLYDLFNDVINLLHTRHSAAYNENGLILFLQVVAEQIPEDDTYRQQVHDLITRLQEPPPPPPSSPTLAPENLRITIVTQLETRFNKSELRQLCFYLNIDYENLDGSSKADKARELVLFMERRDQLLELADAIKRLRPGRWPPPATPPEETIEESPVVVKAEAGPLLIILEGRIGKWQLQVINQGNIHLRQVTLVLRPPPMITTGSNRKFLGSIEAGETISIETPLVIRPNQQTISKDAALPFEVVCRAPDKMERYAGTFIIPIEEGESS